MNDLNSTKQLVTGKSGKKLAALSGKIVKVKFYVTCGDLYAFWISPTTFQSLQVKKPPTRRIRIDGFLFPVQIQCPLPVIEHLIVVVGGNPDSVSFLEEPAFGHVQAHNVLLSFSR